MSVQKSDILIIEDSMAISILMRDFLKKLGYESIETCYTGKTGIQIFSDLVNAGKRPVVLLDVHLPDMNADEIMNNILDIQPDTKIILETADSSTEEQIKILLRQGAYHYLQKPIRYEKMKNIFEILEDEKKILGKDQEIDSLKNTLSYLKSSSRISLARLSEYSKIDSDVLKKYLVQLEHEKKIMKIKDIKEISCSQCNSVNIVQNFFCPSCNGTNFKRGKLIEHFKCGNVSIDQSYKEDMCPKCHKEIKILGIDYRTLENYYICNDCGDKFPDPSQDYICMRCDNRFTLEKAEWIASEGYKISNF